MPGSSAIRAFVAVRLPGELRAAILDCQRRWRSLIAGKTVRWLSEDQWHLTLRFYGNVAADRLPALTEALRSSSEAMAPFQLSVGGLGCFPSWQKPGVIWLGVGGDLTTLENLRERIVNQTKSFGSHAEDHVFHPHLTLARVKAGGREARVIGEVFQTQRVPQLGTWEVREIELIQSVLSPQGSAYRPLVGCPLAKA